MNHTQGFIALTAVLVLSAIFLSISISVATRAISESNSGVAMLERDIARYRAEGCVDYALMELLRTLHYIGDESVPIGDGTCEILTIEGSGSSARTVRTQSIVGAHTYRIEVIINEMSPNVEVSSFERMSFF